jgi:hypothetical protein
MDDGRVNIPTIDNVLEAVLNYKLREEIGEWITVADVLPEGLAEQARDVIEEHRSE